jgi:hypothetical protein
MRNLLHRNDNPVIVYKNVRKYPTVNLTTLCSSWVEVVCFSSRLIFTFLNAGSSVQKRERAIRHLQKICFLNFALHLTPQTKI